ncbi:MAG: hypothetical protein AAF961_12460, partial [Planctomycetota bacterium]
VAYRWDDGVLTILGDLTTSGRTEQSPGGTRMSGAMGISADGTIIVGNTRGAPEADSFRIVHGAIEPIGDLPGGAHNSGVNGISPDGSVVVGRGRSDRGDEAFRWQDGMFEPLGDLPGGEFFSWAQEISADGAVIVGRSESETGGEAFRWTRKTGMVGLGHIAEAANNDTSAWDLTGDGSIVVGNQDGGLGPEFRDAFIWDEGHGMRDLQQVLQHEYGLADELVGWDLISARAISDDGTRVAGAAFNPDGLIEAYVVDLRPVPEPNGMILCSISLLALAQRGAHRWPRGA